jgi:multiple sugar transport system substrate-binding protein
MARASRALTGLAAALLAAASCTPRAAGGGEERVLRFWGLGREGEVVKELVPEFERRNPGIRVAVQQVPWTAAHEKLLTAFVGASTPDIAQVGNTWLPELDELGALADLSARQAGSAVVRQDDYFPGVWDTNVIAGRLVGVPWYVDTRLLFYNRETLALAHVSAPPRSWAEWRATMDRVKATVGKQRYAILLPTDEWAQVVLMAAQAGSPLLRDGDRYGAFSEAEFRRGLELYVSLFVDRLAPALDRNQVANVYQQYAEGLFAMYITGPWNLGEFRSRLPVALRDSLATAPMPAEHPEDWPGVSLAGGSSLAVFRASAHQDAAWRLVEYLSTPERQAAFYAATGDLPARRSAWDAPALAGDEKLRAFFTQLHHVRPMPKVPEWEQIAQRIAEVSEAAVHGKMTIDEAVATLDHDVDRMLEKRRFLLDRKQGKRP